MEDTEVSRFIGDLKRPGWKFWISRVAAVKALGALGPEAKDAVPTLVEVLSEPGCSGELRAAGVEALSAIGPEARSAVPLLVTVIETCGRQMEKPVDFSGPTESVVATIAGPKFLRWSATKAIGSIVGRPWDEDDKSTEELLRWWKDEGSKELW